MRHRGILTNKYTYMKTIESKIAPNPKEAQIWIDLNEDPHGLVKKYWNGKKWVVKEQSSSINKEDIVKEFEPELDDIKKQIDDIHHNIKFLNTHHDEYLLKLIKDLSNRIHKLEQFIVTE